MCVMVGRSDDGASGSGGRGGSSGSGATPPGKPDPNERGDGNTNGNNGGGQVVEATDALGDDAWLNAVFLVVVLAYLFNYFNTKCIC